MRKRDGNARHGWALQGPRELEHRGPRDLRALAAAIRPESAKELMKKSFVQLANLDAHDTRPDAPASV